MSTQTLNDWTSTYDPAAPFTVRAANDLLQEVANLVDAVDSARGKETALFMTPETLHLLDKAARTIGAGSRLDRLPEPDGKPRFRSAVIHVMPSDADALDDVLVLATNGTTGATARLLRFFGKEA